MWAFMCSSSIAAFKILFESYSNYNDSDVANEFNGDFGCMTFIQNPQSGYSEGYKFMIAEYFYRNNQGIVMRVFLFNDIDFIGINPDGSISETSLWFNNYHTFKFMDEE